MPTEPNPAARWMGVELRHLATLTAIGQEGSFRRAAERLGYVPSAASQQIAALERAVGERLVDRASGGGRVRLTATGELLARHASRILGRLHAAQADLQALAADRPDEIRLGLPHGFPGGLLSELVRRFVTLVADVGLRPVEVATSRELYELVRRGELDVALADLPLELGPFDHRELLLEPYVLVLPREPALPQPGGPLTIEGLMALPLILSASQELPLDAAIRDRLEAATVARIDSPASAGALVRAGVGAAIVGASAVAGLDRDVRAVDLSHLLPARRIGLVWHRERRLVHAIGAFGEIAAQLELRRAA